MPPKIIIFGSSSNALLRAANTLSGHGFEIISVKDIGGNLAAVKQLEADVMVFLPDTPISSEQAAQVIVLKTHPPTATTPLIVVTASPDGLSDLPGVAVIPSSNELLDCVQQILSAS